MRILDTRNIGFRAGGRLPASSIGITRSLFFLLTQPFLHSHPLASRYDSFFSSSSSSPSPPFSPLELLDGSSGDAGNVSFVREPVSAGSSNHLFPSSLGYTYDYVLHLPFASYPTTRSPNTPPPIPPFSRSFSRFVLHLTYHLAQPPSIVLHPFFGRRVPVRPAAGSRTRNTNAPVPGSLSSPWMNAAESLRGMEEREVTEPGLSDLRADRFGVHLSTDDEDDEDESDDDPVWPRFIDHEDLDTGSTQLCGSSRLRRLFRLGVGARNTEGENYSYWPW